MGPYFFEKDGLAVTVNENLYCDILRPKPVKRLSASVSMVPAGRCYIAHTTSPTQTSPRNVPGKVVSSHYPN